MKAVIIVNARSVSFTEEQLELRAVDELWRVLETVPVLNNVVVQLSKNGLGDVEAFAEIDLFPAKEELHIICEVKNNGEPRIIRQAVDDLLLLKRQLENKKGDEYYGIIAAPYISPASGKICEEMDVGYLDFSGNCLLSYKSIYIRVEGKPNQFKETRGSRSIFERSSIKSSVILRNLLHEPDRKWRIKELADVSGVSVGQVAKVKSFLEDREFIYHSVEGFSLQNVKELIKAWAEVYHTKSNSVMEYYAFQAIPEFEQQLVQMRNKLGIEYALTGFAGGARYAPVVRYKKIHFYIYQRELQKAVEYLECKKVESGANISIFIPYDSCVLLHTREIKGDVVVSPVQICLDLMGLKGRGEEAAHAVMAKEFDW